ncbi:hypothetical protein OJAV_G00130760 [Oryzias javanicus]|uniref:Ig-like domain-containing protein n=1 Tax=Oryzias javanicus TaxID=123683 RepID=A0A437CQ54_ORYJA|nr:hypothetical protein OJAV_G00130760 [Oryzias javanicus]
MVLEVKIDSSLNEKFISHSEMPSFSPNYRNSQESRTITSDRPYPKPRFQGRRGFRGRLWQRRRVAAHNRHVGSGRIFNKASKKVDPQKFAELMKKAQEGLKIKTGQKEEMEKYENNIFSDGGEIGSGEDHDNNHSLFDPEIVKPTPQITALTQTRETYPVTTDVLKNPDIENSMRHYGHSRQETKYSDPVTTDKSTFPTPTEYYTQEIATIHLTNTHPINHQHLAPETQLRVLEKGDTNTETSTDGALLITTDPFTSPMKDGPKQAELVVHTDADGQTTFTAITTTERLQEEITFHTIQTIKSPGLSAGSTIISQQQIQIIPQNKGKGRRRTFHSRRRIVKPGRITDIKSFINRVKQPTARKEENASVPIQINLTTDRNSDEDSKKTVVTDVQLKAPKPSLSPYLSTTERLKSTQKTSTSTTSDYITSNLPTIHGRHAAEVTAEDITSADSPDMDATRDSSFTTNKNVLVTTTASTSKAIPKKNDWNQLFGGRDRPKKRSRLRKPSVATKASTTAKILVTTTTVASTTTTGPPTKPLLSKQSSIEDKYERLDSVGFELRTTGLTFHHFTTTSLPCYSKTPTTAGTPPELRTLPSPPTVNPHVIENPEELLSSGSGALPDNINTIRQKTGGIMRWKGMGRRRPFQGRRPLKKPVPTKATQTASTLSSSVDITVMESTMEKTTQPQQIVSSYSSLNIPPMKMNRTVKADFSSLTVFTTTKTPLVTFSAHKPTTTLVPETIKQPYTAASNEIDINKQPQTQKKQHSTTNTSVKRLIPTLQSGGARNGEVEDLTFDKMTIFETQSGYNFPVPFNKELENSKSTIYDKITDNKAPYFSASGFEPKSKVIGSKPRIIGGNAASFTVLSNSDAFLPCEAVGNPQPVVTWMHFSSTGSTISIRGRMGKFDLWSNGTLSIQRANIKDHGQYLCLAENDYGSDKLLVTLSVVAYPSRILEPRMREIKSHTRSTVELTCKAEGRPMPTFSWILANRTQIREHGPEKARVSVSSEGTLTIKDVSVFDRGFYKCIASNPAGADTATVRLQVVAAPPNILEEKRQQLKPSLGQNLWVPCTGHGSPQPTVHWVLHDGSVILLDKTTSNKRTTLFKNGTLSIRDVTPADNGNYECIATSSTGSERRVVTLTVETQQSAPQIVKTSELVTELSYGEQLRLNCLATGDPKPKIMWRLPSRAVVDHWHRMSSRIAVLDNGTLIVNTVIDKDAGEYLCVAQSTVGDDLQLMRVSVSMKPAKIESKPDGKKQIHVGNELKVDCKATGAPNQKSPGVCQMAQLLTVLCRLMIPMEEDEYAAILCSIMGLSF